MNYLQHPTYLALLAAVIASPTDDLPRLALCDWLDEFGSEEAAIRSQFIRDQIHTDQLGLKDGKCETGCICGGAGARAAKALRRYGDRWNPRYEGEGYGTQFDWKRGFVWKVEIDTGNWFTVGRDIVRDWPIESLVLTDREPADTGYGSRWTWFGPHPIARVESDGARLPGFIWERLPRLDYPTKEEAIAAASSSALTWARCVG